MKLSVPAVLLAALVLSACSRPVVKETVIERPVIGASGASAPSCTWASQSYSSGAMTCQDRTGYRCNNGTWERTQMAC